MSSFRAFLAELKRRRVWRVGAVYAATAFVVVQVADLTFERLGLPPWATTLVIVLALLGFPLALVLAWAFEVTPEGVRRAEPALADAATGPIGHRLRVAGLGAALVLLAGGGWWITAGRSEAGPAEIDRLAVLPLSNLMGDPEQEYFVRGTHDRLISELQQAGIPVIARTSVMRYGTAETPIREIARELGVDALIEGSVFRAGDSVEVEVRLVDGVTEEYLWRDAFVCDLSQIHHLHQEVTSALAERILGALGPEDSARLAESKPVDPRAYEAYLKGTFHAERWTPGDLATALEYFETALEIDSAYAPAHLGVAWIWGVRAQDGHASAEEARRHAEPAVARALALDSTSSEAYSALAGRQVWADWHVAAGEASYRRAIELNPGHARSRALYGHLLSILGQWDEAAEQTEAARRLDPLNPFTQALGATQLWLAGRNEEAIAILRDEFRRNPGAGFGRSVLAGALNSVGRREEALQVWREWYRMRGESDVVAALERENARGGPEAAYRRAAEALLARGADAYAAPFDVAVFYNRAGETEEAIASLRAALEERDQNMPYIGVLPVFRNLHRHPEFRNLARRVGVPVLPAPSPGEAGVGVKPATG